MSHNDQPLNSEDAFDFFFEDFENDVDMFSNPLLDMQSQQSPVSSLESPFAAPNLFPNTSHTENEQISQKPNISSQSMMDLSSLPSKKPKKKPTNTESNEEKRRRRLERNRESARQSRRRKKQQLENIEQTVIELTQELDSERNKFLQRYQSQKNANKIELLTQIKARIEKGAFEEHPESCDSCELEQFLEEYERHHSVLNEEELELFEYHFEHLINLLMPTYAKYFIWLVNRHKVVQRSELNKDDVFDAFCQELNLTTAQKEKIKGDFKQQLNHEEEHKRLSFMIGILQQTRSAFEIRRKTIKTQKRVIFDILKPEYKAEILVKELESSNNAEPDIEMLKREFKDDLTMSKTLELLQRPDDQVSMDELKFLLHVVNR